MTVQSMAGFVTLTSTYGATDVVVRGHRAL